MLKESVIYPFHRSLSNVCLGDRRKRIKKYAFLYKSALVWTGENKPKKASVGENILPRFVKTKTDTFKNALVWLGDGLGCAREQNFSHRIGCFLDSPGISKTRSDLQIYLGRDYLG